MVRDRPPIFNLLSIGHRGVGKSVFLAGCYAELQKQSQGIWIEGANYQTQLTIDAMLSYMAKNGRYVAATMKITDFILRIKSQVHNQYNTLCEFRWADIPGEICHLDNPDFKALMLDSHGCCVFIDAAALVQNKNYIAQLEETIQQIETISALATQRNVSYFFALILTKCDQLTVGSDRLAEIEQKWQSLTARLVTANTVYRRFNSSVSLIPTGNTAVVKPEGASAPILWLVSELSNVYQTQGPKNLRGDVEQPPMTTKHTVLSRRSKSILAKVLIMQGAVFVVLAIWLGLGKLVQNTETEQIPNIEESSLGRD